VSQGHALFTRQAGSDLPCPPIDFTGGFNQYFGAAYNLTGNDTIASKFGAPFSECPLLPSQECSAGAPYCMRQSVPLHVDSSGINLP
jgi:hypothetical protein